MTPKISGVRNSPITRIQGDPLEFPEGPGDSADPNVSVPTRVSVPGSPALLGQWLKTLAECQNHQGRVKNCRYLALTLRDSDLLGLWWGLGTQILRSPRGKLFQNRRQRQMNETERGWGHDLPSRLFIPSFCHHTPHQGPTIYRVSPFHKWENRGSQRFSDLSKFQRSGRARAGV